MSSNVVSSVLASGALLFAGREIPAQDSPSNSIDLASASLPARRELAERPALSGSFSSSFRSHYLPSGFDVGEGPFQDGLLSMNFGPRVGGYAWGIYDLGRGPQRFDEVDLGLLVKSPSFKVAGGKAEARLTYDHWIFLPSGAGPLHENLLGAGVHWSGPIEADLSVTGVLPNKHRDPGLKISAAISRELASYRFGPESRIAFGAAVKTDYLDGFLQSHSAWSHVTPSASASYENGNFSVAVSAGYQFRIDRLKENVPHYQAGISWKF